MTPAPLRPHTTNQRLSLQRQLLLWLLLPQLLLWLVGGLLAFSVALRYAEKVTDQSLSQSVRSLARQVKPIGSGLLIDFPRAAQAMLEQDPQDRVVYMVSSPPGQFLLGNLSLPGPPPGHSVPDDQPLLYETTIQGKAMRVASIETEFGDEPNPQRLRVQVAKSLTEQQRIAQELVRDVFVPLLGVLALLSVLVHAGIRRGLQPLQRLEAQLAHRTHTSLSPLELQEAPQEVSSLATTLNTLLASLQRSLGQEKRFLNDAAHQLRTPLAGLISQTELALREQDPQALHERLLKVHSGAQRSAHLVHQLLSLARTEADIELQSTDLAALAREVAREWIPRALAAGMDLGYEGEQHLVVPANRLLLREALSNLLDNALRYAGSGHSVTLRASQQAKQAVLEVEDDGPGLSSEQLEHVFERFWRASEQPQGCGLGLAIVAEILQRHRGSAQAQTVLPHGFRVSLRLPMA
ncbi:sensor histidine kinase [Curvibacter sp. CHRR-16]|uniref:sensor histidine kinase n=1 Tax=Curvibacter sp. CHRR-16 TaxID=2835872 RepID=UPI001BDB40CE|nr:sensor histidine kinase [Curvibacter sp. CHRR-16]MBT0570927.1 sensor histidine kinase [Curvibacter sp. CHRR-16]